MAGLAAVGSYAGAAGWCLGAVAGEQRRPPTGAAGVAAGGARIIHGESRHHDAAPWPCGPVAVVGLSALSLWVTELKPVASELQPWSWPPRRPDLRLVHTCRDRSRPARTGGSRCRVDPARTSTTARRRLRSHLVDSLIDNLSGGDYLAPKMLGI